MYCPKCGKENPDDARFCMHCGADLSGYKVEMSPKIEVSPKISVSAKAEGGVALKWKRKPEKYAWIICVDDYHMNDREKAVVHRLKEGSIKLPVYEEFVSDGHNIFCPSCGNYGCLEEETRIFMGGIYKVLKNGEEREIFAKYGLYHCLACDCWLLRDLYGKEKKGRELLESVLTETEGRLLEYVKDELIPTKFEKYLFVEDEKIPVYNNVLMASSGDKDFLLNWVELEYCSCWVDIKGKGKTFEEWQRELEKVAVEEGAIKKGDNCVLTGQKKILRFVEKLDISLNPPYVKGEIFCPRCKRKSDLIVTGLLWTIYISPPTEIFSTSRLVVDAETGKYYALCKCEICGKFLAILKRIMYPKDMEEKKDFLISYTPKAYPSCEFCGNASGEYKCDTCGKRYCKNCAVIREGAIKKGLLFKKSTATKKYLCPNCNR